MAEIVTGAISTLLPKLSKGEYQLQKTIRGEIMSLMNELEWMQATLLEVPFIVRVDEPRRFRGFIDRSLNLLTKFKIRHKIGCNIRDIKSHIKEVGKLRDKYNVDGVRVAKPVGQTVDFLRLLSALDKKASDLVATEKKTDDLVRRLMEMHDDVESKQKLKVVSIVGFGGLGKTTLANVVYQKLKGEFDCGAFVSISLNPNLVGIFKNLLRQLDEDKYRNINGETWDEGQLINELKKFLQNKRYIVVIDDIWNNSVWKTIKYALVENELGSKIITTTRAIDVAEQVGVGGDYFDELMNKGMIQPADRNVNNYIKSYRIHDMVLDLITSLSNKEHFLTRLDGHQSLSLPKKKIRRLSLQTNEEEDVKQLATISMCYHKRMSILVGTEKKTDDLVRRLMEMHDDVESKQNLKATCPVE
ncbi:hypothetical protein E2562_017359 [Oryza meyeriana var. granulata]|uniref:NB-ARC domain-containing protein n=1 Tax=Oryza meyeriana var. granulata TaxID=110450 RepID=A0A6G1D3V9_9ORYZ|nr:hypothetical protein E2562_017359 [Oryza meyeriana var. granulata]